MKIKPCPFCGKNEAEVEHDEIDNPNPGYSAFPYVVVRCRYCLAQAKTVRIKYFNQFSRYGLADFRKSDALRDREEKRYELYLDEQETKAVALWNRRMAPAAEPESEA